MLFLDDARFRLYSRTLIVFYVVAWGLILGLGHGLRDANGRIRGGDFVLYYAAARLAAGDQPRAAYDYKANYLEENAIMGEDIVHPLFFMHPPSLLLALLPLARLPFWLALVVFDAVSLLAGYLVATRFRLPRQETLLLYFAAPAMFQCLIQGQITLVLAALATAGLLAAPRRPGIGGVLLGLTLVKPHLVAPVFFYLLLKKRWRCLGWALATAAVLAGLAEYALGGGLWLAFVENLPRVSRIVEAGFAPLAKMTTAYAGLKLLGLGDPLAYAAQAVSALAALAAVALAVVRVREPRLECAVVLAGGLLVPHYAYDYDWTLVLFSVFCLAGYVREAGLVPSLGLRIVAGGAYAAPLLVTALARAVPVQLGPVLLWAYLAGLLLLGIARARESAP
jgi:hypothetical protein